MTGTLSKSELRRCIFWLAKLHREIRCLGTDAQSLLGELAELRGSCTGLLAEINHPNSYIHGLRCRDRQAIYKVLKKLGASMQSLYQAVVFREDLDKDIILVAFREELDKDIILQAMQPCQLAKQVEAFDIRLAEWLDSARNDEHLDMRFTISRLFSKLKDIKSLTDTTLEAAGLVSETETRSPTLTASPRHTPGDSDIE